MQKPPLTDIDYVQSLLAKTQMGPKRSMGQNFLISPEVIEATITVLQDGPKHVTELGAGIGVLTQALTAHGFSVRAIEKDDRMLPILEKHITGDAKVIHDDLKDVDWTWDTPYQVAGNIPYNMTGYIIRRVTQLSPAPTQALFLMQEEVAQRILARPGQMSLLSLAVQLWGTAHHVLTVPRNCFWPQPKVTSALLLLLPSASANPNREDIIAFAKPCFQEKRKQIGGVLKKNKTYSAKTIEDAFTATNIRPSARPQELSSEQWVLLWETLRS